MRKTLCFASRCAKEMLRDKLNLAFGLGFPLIVLLLLSLIQANIPVELFRIDQLAPGVAVFGLSFVSLFSGMLVARDRTSALMLRLFTSPMTAGQFLMGYVLPLIPISLAQSAVCLLVGVCLGLPVSANLLLTLVVLLPAALLFIAIGVLCGTCLNDKQVGGFCGALLTNLSAWLSGIWFDPKLVGGVFEKIANALPFLHAVNAARSAAAGNTAVILGDLAWVTAYAAALFILAAFVFAKKMRTDQK